LSQKFLALIKLPLSDSLPGVFPLDKPKVTLYERSYDDTLDIGAKMGEFLSMTGVAGASQAAVERVFVDFTTSRQGILEPAPRTDDPDGQLIIAPSPSGNVTVLYPRGFTEWDEMSLLLSESLRVPTISMYIHDGDLWMYTLFVDGKDVDWFNPIPAYWSDELSDDERSQWAGDAKTLAQHWPGVSEESVKNYLVPWGEDGPTEKAYPTDQFSANDCWQLVDFMGKLDLTFPIDDSGKTLGSTFTFSVKRRRNR